MVRSHPIVLLVALCLVSPESMRAQERATPPRERHPCVLCGTEEAELLRERCSREPYATWRRSIEATAREALAAAPDDLGDTYRRASRAKALAFLAWIEPVDRTARVERAILCLSRLDAPLEKGRFTGNYVHFPNACSDASEAYDFLCAVVGTTDPRLAPIRARLVEFAGALHDSDPGWYAWHWNNWQIRQFSCLGSFAIVLADDPAAAKWARTAENAVRKCYDYQACGDGAWAEGHSYFAYSAEHFLPYFFALRRAGGRDFFVEPMVRETHEWSVKSRLPDGRRPNFDDSHIARYPSHWLTGAWKDSVFRWDRESSDEPTWPGFSPVDAICFYDDTVAAAPPSWNPTQFLVEGGDIIFRSGWDRDAIYMNLRAEHGDPRTHGGGHEHPDETSFLLYSGSTPLCIDSGYINYAEHAKVYNAGNHSLILVEGQGPANSAALGAAKNVGGDAFAGPCFTSDSLDYVEVRAKYAGVEVTRCVAFVERRYFLIVDVVTADRPHRYTSLFHLAPGDRPVCFPGDGYDAELGRSGSLGVLMFTYPPASCSLGSGLHSFDHGTSESHPVLRLDSPARQGPQPWTSAIVMTPAGHAGDGGDWKPARLNQAGPQEWQDSAARQFSRPRIGWETVEGGGVFFSSQTSTGETQTLSIETPVGPWLGAGDVPTSPDEFVRADRAITWLSRVPRPSAVGAGNPVTGAARDCSLIFEGKPITLQVPNAAKFRALLDGVPLEMKPGTHPDSGVLTVPHPGRLVIEER